MYSQQLKEDSYHMPYQQMPAFKILGSSMSGNHKDNIV